MSTVKAILGELEETLRVGVEAATEQKHDPFTVGQFRDWRAAVRRHQDWLEQQEYIAAHAAEDEDTDNIEE